MRLWRSTATGRLTSSARMSQPYSPRAPPGLHPGRGRGPAVGVEQSSLKLVFSHQVFLPGPLKTSITPSRSWPCGRERACAVPPWARVRRPAGGMAGLATIPRMAFGLSDPVGSAFVGMAAAYGTCTGKGCLARGPLPTPELPGAMTVAGAQGCRPPARHFGLNTRAPGEVNPGSCRMNLEVAMRRLNLPLLLLVGAVSTAVLADDEDLTLEQERDQIGANMEAERKGEQPALNNSGVPSSAATPGAGSGSSVGSPTTTTGNPPPRPVRRPRGRVRRPRPRTPTTGQGVPTNAPATPRRGKAVRRHCRVPPPPCRAAPRRDRVHRRRGRAHPPPRPARRPPARAVRPRVGCSGWGGGWCRGAAAVTEGQAWAKRLSR